MTAAGEQTIPPRPPRPAEPLFENFPSELTIRYQWVGWAYEMRDGRPTKVPRQPNGTAASVIDPATWSPFEHVQIAYETHGYDGVGFVLTPDDPFCAFDFDHVVDAATGQITDARVRDWIVRLNSYTEISPSGTGLRVIVRAELPAQDRRIGNFECYQDKRFVSITGWIPRAAIVSTSVVADRQEEVEAIHSEMFRDRKAKRESAGAQVHLNGASRAVNLDDHKLLDKARAAKNGAGAKFAELYDRGNWKGAGLDSQSEADLALLGYLAFWTACDKERMRRLFRRSALMREKFERADYATRTINEATAGRTEVYQGWEHATVAGNGRSQGSSPGAEPLVDGVDSDSVNPNAAADRENPDRGGKAARPKLTIEGGDAATIVDYMVDILAKEHQRAGIYEQNGRLVRIASYARREDRPEPLIRRAEGAPILKSLTSPAVRDVAGRYIDFQKIDRRTRKKVSIDCSSKHADILLERAGDGRFPPLVGVIYAPLLRPDGTILSKLGYDEQTGLLLVADLSWPAIPDNPSAEDVAAAVKVLRDPFDEFPFVSENDRAVFFSAVMTLIARRQLETAPLHAYDAPIQSAGKTLLADLSALIGTGYPAATITAGYDKAELEKRLVTSMLTGDAAINIDNLDWPLRSDFLASVLTRSSIDTRIMGGNVKAANLPTNMLFMVTGNNLRFSGDMPSRVIASRLDPEMERPEERKFRIPNLRIYVAKHRGELVSAALTILKGHYLAGRPQNGLALFGRFEQWSLEIRAALVWAGFGDPCKTRERIVSDDPERDTTVALLNAWHARIAGESITARSVITAADADETLRFALLDVAADSRDEKIISAQRLGKWCQLHVDRMAGGYCLRKVAAAPSSTGRWLVEKPREAVA
jgi:hypothetical protein